MQSNFFKLLGLPEGFDVDADRLDTNHKKLQKQFHPDKFAAASAAEQRVAMQYAMQINEAYTCLKDPLTRAQYLMQLVGYDSKEHTLKSDPDFLFQQMAWRDDLESATSLSQLNALSVETATAKQHFQHAFVSAYQDKDFDSAQDAIDKLQFVVKFERELKPVIVKMEA